MLLIISVGPQVGIVLRICFLIILCALLGPNGSTPVYIGRELKLNSFIRFNSGGAGYVLNRPAVATLHDALVVNSEDSGDVCMPSLYCNQEDVLVASCLSQVKQCVLTEGNFTFFFC